MVIRGEEVMYKQTISFMLLLLLYLVQGNVCFAKASLGQVKQAESNSYFYAPAGMTCDAVLSENIHSSSTVIGQNVSVILIDDLKYKNKTIASSGSIISGTVIQNKVAGKGSDSTKMKIRFTSIRTPYNNIIPISAIVFTGDKSGYIYAQTKNREDNVVLSANSKVNLLFDQPITVSAQ